MIVILKPNAPENKIQMFLTWAKDMGVIPSVIGRTEYTVIGLAGDTTKLDLNVIRGISIVDKVKRIQEPYKLANRKIHPEDTQIQVGKLVIGEGSVTVMAGPCSIEGQSQISTIAQLVKDSGASVLRGGAFKPRTSPYAFQGMGKEGIQAMIQARKETGLSIVTEIMSIEDLDYYEDVDILQLGARNMQNFALLKELGKLDKPILLKRGFSATLEELLMSAEYIMSGGNHNVIFCERGIRTYETATRNTLDISAIPFLKSRSHLPVIIDPSHAAGSAWMVPALSRAAIAAGADGLIVEVHHNPEKAWSDGAQSLKPEDFSMLMKELHPLANLMGKKLNIIA